MPVPVRFIFFLVGPHDASEDYNETGRAFATIMSTPVSATYDFIDGSGVHNTVATPALRISYYDCIAIHRHVFC